MEDLETFVAVSAKALIAVACDVNRSGLVCRIVSGCLTSLMRFGNAEISCVVRSVEYSHGGAEDTSGEGCLVRVVVLLGCGEWCGRWGGVFVGVVWLLGGGSLTAGDAWSAVSWSCNMWLLELFAGELWSRETLRVDSPAGD